MVFHHESSLLHVPGAAALPGGDPDVVEAERGLLRVEPALHVHARLGQEGRDRSLGGLPGGGRGGGAVVEQLGGRHGVELGGGRGQVGGGGGGDGEAAKILKI